MIEKREADDDVNLYVYVEMFVRRKWLFIGIFLSILLITLAVDLSSTKIYRGYVRINLVSAEYSDVLGIINRHEEGKYQDIVPNAYGVLRKIELSVDSVAHRVTFTLDVTDTNKVNEIGEALVFYMSNFPSYQKSIEVQKQSASDEMEETQRAIRTLNELLKAPLNDNLAKDSLSIGTIPKTIVDLRLRKEKAEQQLKEGLATKVTGVYILVSPVSPKTGKDLALMGVIGVLASIFCVFVREAIHRFRMPVTP